MQRTTQLLSQLQGLHLNTELAWGWWLIIAVSILLVIMIISYSYYIYKKNQHLFIAIKKLKKLQKNVQLSLINISLVIKSTLKLDARGKSLTGEKWLKFLDSKWKKPLQDCFLNYRQEFINEIYRSESSTNNLQEISKLTINWLKQQKSYI